MSQARLKIRPLTLAQANAKVAAWHRHHKPTIGHRFSIGAFAGDECVGVAIIGRPLARVLPAYQWCEILRLATNGTSNACSALYGAASRIARAMGFDAILTYTLTSEPGTSLRAAGWIECGAVTAESWSRQGRLRIDGALLDKRRWFAPWSAPVKAAA